MADNSTQTGADTIATDDVTTLNGGASSGVKVQRVKVGYGDDGTHRDVSATWPLHVNLAASQGGTAQVSGSLTASAAATISGTASTTGSVVIDVGAAGNASFHLLATAFVGTVVFEQSFDPAGANGTWAPVKVIPEDQAGPPFSTLTINTAVAYIRQFTAAMFGPKLFRVRCSVFTSGTLAVLGSAGPGWYEGSPALAPSDVTIGAVSLAAGTTPALATVNTSGTANTNASILASDATRKAIIVTNAGTGVLSLAFGSVATTSTLYSVKLQPGDTYEVPPQFAPFAINAQSTVATNPVNITSVT